MTLRIGAFTFGGGYAMIPMMRQDFVEKEKWISDEDIVDVFAVGQSLPGVIAVNVSVMIGYRIAGVAGGILAALGSVLPSFAVLAVVTLFYQSFITNAYVIGFMRGVRGAVVALFASAVVKLYRQSVSDNITLIFFLVSVAVSLFLPAVHPAFVILGGGLLGVGVKMWLKRREKARG